MNFDQFGNWNLEHKFHFNFFFLQKCRFEYKIHFSISALLCYWNWIRIERFWMTLQCHKVIVVQRYIVCFCVKGFMEIWMMSLHLNRGFSLKTRNWRMCGYGCEVHSANCTMNMNPANLHNFPQAKRQMKPLKISRTRYEFIMENEI